MKSPFLRMLILCLLLAAGTKGFGQLIIGGQASYLTGDDQSLWGGGAQIKVLLGGRLAVGATVRSYPKEYSESEVGTGDDQVTVRSANTITPVLGTLEYYFGKESGIQPYIGADAGLYLHKIFTEAFDGNTLVVNTDEGKTYFGVAPKFGLMFKTGGLIAPFVQAQYHFNFGSGEGDDITIPGINSPWESKVANSFATFDVGIAIRLRSAGK